MGNPVPLSVIGIGSETYDNSTLNMLLPMHVQLDSTGRVSMLARHLPNCYSNSIQLKANFCWIMSVSPNPRISPHIGIWPGIMVLL